MHSKKQAAIQTYRYITASIPLRCVPAPSRIIRRRRPIRVLSPIRLAIARVSRLLLLLLLLLGRDVREVGVPDAPTPREAETREDGDEGDDGRDGDAYARAGRERAAFAANAGSFGCIWLHLVLVEGRGCERSRDGWWKQIVSCWLDRDGHGVVQ